MRFPKVLAILLAITALTSTASAAIDNLGYGTETVEITIPINQDMAYFIPMKVGDKLIVELEVSEGGPVDFFFTNGTAYGLYLASLQSGGGIDALYTIEDYSRREAGGISYTYNALVANEIVVVIDNTGYTLGGAEPLGPVSIEGKITVQQNVWTLQNIIITILAVAIILAIMVGIRWPRKPALKS